MKIERIILTLENAKADVEWNCPLNYYIAIDEAIKYLKIFKDMFEGARMTSHKENNNEHTNI
jgi:hypothetical protein